METPKPDGSPDTKTSSTPTGSSSDDKSLLNEGEDKTPTGAPETYADFTAPEGFELNKEVIDKATPIFKELGLSQEGAQRLVSFYAEQARVAAEAPYELFDNTQKEWRDAVMADPALGKNLPAIKETIGRAYDAIGDAKLTAEFKSVMDLTGAGNHPAFVKMVYALAQRVTEGKHVSGSGPSPLGQLAPGSKPPSAAQALYPNLPSG